MNLFTAQKKDLNLFEYFSKSIGAIILLFPFIIISGTAVVEISANFIGLYGLIILIKNKKKKFNSIFYLLTLIFIFANISSFLGENLSNSFSRSIFLFRYPLFFLGVYYYLTLNQKYIIYILYYCILSILFVYFDDIVQLIFGYDIFGFEKQNHRLSGPFDDELIPGIFLFRFGLISIASFIYIKNIGNNYTYILLVLLLIGVILTGEKTTSVLTFLSISLFIILNYGLKKILIIIYILIAFVGSFYILINSSDIYKERIWYEAKRTIPIFNKDRTFLDSEHGVMFYTAFNIWKDNKIFGTGLKSYREECKNEKYSNIDSMVVNERCSTHPHNFYFELLSELGIVGLILFAILIFYILFKIYMNYLRSKNVITLSIFCTLCGIFFPIAFTNSLFTNFNLLWIVFIISLGFIKITNEKN